MITIVALTIPLLVAVVVCAVARSEGSAVPWLRLALLAAATLAALAASTLFPRPLFALPASLVLFAAFVIPVTRALEKSALARLQLAEVRTATLVPRRVSAYIPFSLRAISLVALLAAMAGVVVRAMSATPPLLFTFTFAALTFFGLYESWLRQEVFAVRAGDERDRTRRVRAVFAAQHILALAFFVLAALAAGPWPGFGALGVTAGIIGGIGCALALSTGIQQRYLGAQPTRMAEPRNGTTLA